MYIARILYPIRVLGPGNRIGIWFAGCEHHCDGCSNPELWEKDLKYKTSLDTIISLINGIVQDNKVDGFTLTGGDPFYQPEALRTLLLELRKISDDILVYTGYEYENVVANYPDIVEHIAVLIDGKYIKERNRDVILRGSDNQRIVILNTIYADVYNNYLLNRKNEIQNFRVRDAVISVGIHRLGYEQQLNYLLKEKGLNADE